MNPPQTKKAMMVKRYSKSFMAPQAVPGVKIGTTVSAAPAAPAKPKLVVQGRNAYWQNGDGSRTPYKKNIVDKVVDRVLSPY